MIPDGWNNLVLGDIVTHIKGFAFSSNDYSESGKRIIRISDTSGANIRNDSGIYYSGDDLQSLQRYSLSEKDIIVNTVGSRPHLRDSMVGRVIRIQKKFGGSLLNQNMVKLSSNNKSDPDFLFYTISNDRFLDFISRIVRGNANQVSITLNDLFSFPILLPTLPEQQRIAEILSTWDKAIEMTEKLIANSEAQKKALMQQLLTGKKRLQGFDGEWSKRRLDNLAIVTMGSSPKSETYNETGDGLPLLQGNADIKGGRSFPRVFTNDPIQRCAVGDILLSVRAPVGSIAVSDHEACIGRGLAAITPRSHSSYNFLLEFLKQQESKWQSLSQGSTFEAVNSKDVKGIIVPIPPSAEEFEALGKLFATSSQQLSSLKKLLDRLTLEKSALMQQLLTGKRRVKIDQEDAA